MESRRQRLFLHIGYPKTATTVLQKHYFPKLKDIFYAGINYNSNPKFLVSETAVECLVHGDVDKARKLRLSISESLAKESAGKDILFAFEKIIGSIFTPRRTPGGRWHYTSPEQAVETIRALFDPEIFDLVFIITIRNQAELIPSKYAQSFSSAYSRFNEYSTFEKFIKRIYEDSESNIRSGFDYNRVIQCFEGKFGQDRINILLFEQFDESPDIFLQQLCAVIGIEHDRNNYAGHQRENVRSSSDGIRSHTPVSLLNKLGDLQRRFFPWLKLRTPKVFKPLGRLRFPRQKNPGEIRLSTEKKQQILSIYDSSNRQLSQRFGLNLEQYNYFPIDS